MSLFNKGDSFLLRLSKTKHLLPITFIVAFFEATISPLLPELFLLIVLAYRKNISWLLLSIVSALGSASGALTMFFLGKTFYSTYGKTIITYLGGDSIAEKARELFISNAFAAQFFASLTPLPDRVFSLLAGAFLVSPFIIFIATFCGRLVRVIPFAYLSYEYGDEARDYMKKHQKTAWIGIALCIVFYFCYKLFK
jgi:membrane protein YqaA with SNARE-associated domain